jgi:metal-responsive CopG/Arc/MetJ family transcriptional regulator
MKVKTSVTLSDRLLEAVGERLQQYRSRSEFLEAAAWAFLRQMAREEQEARDLDIINRRSDALNQEAADVLEYQPAFRTRSRREAAERAVDARPATEDPGGVSKAIR